MLVFVQMYLWITFRYIQCVSTIVIELSVSVLRFGV